MSSSPAWLDWGTAAFSRAARLDRPVLLLVTTWWAEAGRALERTTLSDAAIIALVDEAFVPVRVDADRRPDIAERYTLEGWPTLVALTPHGQPLGGGTFVDAGRLGPALRGVADAYRARRDDLLRQSIASPWLSDDGRQAASAPDGTAWEVMVDAMAASYDRTYGGFGVAEKRLDAPALLVALAQLANGEHAGLARAVTHTLDAVGARLVSQRGGVQRAAGARDWSAIDRACLLEVQADAVRVYLEAWSVLGDDRYRASALATVAFARAALTDAVLGGFFAAELDGEVDRTIDVGANCRMARALLHAGTRLDDTRLVEDAVRALERVVPAAYARNAGLAHYLDPQPRVRGLLADQVAGAAALLEAYAVTGSAAYADLAEELVRFALSRLWHAGRGAFVDRVATPAGAGDVGWLGVPFEPFALNCEAASVLAQLGRLTGDARLHEHALAILRRFAQRWRAEGLDGACYALAVRDVLLSPEP